jgi:alpha-L-rhamnosidase
MSTLRATSLRCEFLTNPIGIDNLHPRLSWVLESDQRNQKQSAYRIVVASSEEQLTRDFGDLWDTGKVLSNLTHGVVYDGARLLSGMHCYWKVRAWNGDDEPSAWSSNAHWSMGLLSASDWKAEWIGYDAPRRGVDDVPFSRAEWIWFSGDKGNEFPPGVRCFARIVEIPIGQTPTRAVIHIAADDRFVLAVNGNVIAESNLPRDSWKEPQQIDVTSSLHPGSNLLLVKVENVSSGPAGLTVWMAVHFANAAKIVIVTDRSWVSTDRVGKEWTQLKAEELHWPEARVLGFIGAPPWRYISDSALFLPPPRYLQKDVSVTKPVRRATLYAAALGLCDVFLDGRRISEDHFPSGWTDYARRVYYRTYDITRLIHEGVNSLGVILADGWYSGYVGFGLIRDHYGRNPRVLLQLDVEHQDGTHTVIGSRSDWRAATGPIREADLLEGELYDARIAAENDFGLQSEVVSWDPVDVGAEVHPAVQAHPAPPVRVVAEFKPVSITEPIKGVFIFDLGQNFAGVARLRVRGEAGQKITLRFGERLNPDGTILTMNLRGARARDVYICRGGGEEVWNPRFTFHGFQYVEATGLTEPPTRETITGLALSSDVPVTGSFECSEPMLNRLAKNVFWTQRANFIDIPTDCPQRDERLGWTGDAQAYAPSACLNADVQAFLHKWIQDLVDAQRADGQFPMVAPLKVAGDDGGPAWADAGVTCPWTIYEMYDDRSILEQHYDAMARFIEFCRMRSTPDMLPPASFHCFGDWVSINAETPNDVIFITYFARCAEIMGKTAEILGKQGDSRAYAELFQKIKSAFNRTYVDSEGRIKGNTQTAYVLALASHLLDGVRRERAIKYLLEDIEARRWHLSTGFVGTKDLMLVLSAIGRDDVAYRLLLNDTFPSWGYTIKNGATTIWERWDGWTEEKGFQDPGMNSFAHYAFGAVYQWMVENIGGIRSEGPGYHRIIIEPKFNRKITWARVGYDSIHGQIESSWRWDAPDSGEQNTTRFHLSCKIPANTEAVVSIPATDTSQITESGKSLTTCPKIHLIKFEGNRATLAVGSGEYAFFSIVEASDREHR